MNKTTFNKYFLSSVPIMCGLILSFFIRTLFPASPFPVLATADSYGYYALAWKIVSEPSAEVFFNNYRTPLYPLLISAIMKPEADLFEDSLKTNFAAKVNRLYNIQMAIGTVSLILYFLIIKNITASRMVQIFLIILYSTNVSLFRFERMMLTENLSIFLFALSTLTIIKYLQSRSLGIGLLYIAFSWLLFLTKPFFVALTPLLLGVIFVMKPDKQNLCKSLFLIFLYLTLPFIYISANRYFHGYTGINHASDINLLGRIIQFKLDISPGKSFTEFYPQLQAFKAINDIVPPYQFLEYLDKKIYDQPEKLDRLRQFVSVIIRANFFSFLKQATPDLVRGILQPGFDINELYKGILGWLVKLHQIFRYLVLVIIPGSIIFLISSGLRLRSLSRKNRIITLLNLSAVYTLTLAAFGSYDHFGRLTIPAVPVFYLLTAEFLIIIINFIKNFRRRSNRLPIPET